MEIKSVGTSFTSQNSRQNVIPGQSFGIHASQLKALSSCSMELCLGEEKVFSMISGFFSDISLLIPKKFSFNYKLGERNNVPKTLQKLNYNGITMAKMDEFLNQSFERCNVKFKCRSRCNEAQLTIGARYKAFLAGLKVDNAGVIEMKSISG